MARHALVVGGARGIGRGITAALLDDGFAVTIAGRTSRAPELEAAGATWQRLDASDPEQVAAVVGAIDPVDVLVVCAGPYHRVPLMRETPQGWRSMLANNLDCVFYLAQAVLPGMRERGWGRILTFSMAGAEHLKGNPMVTAHYIAKVGVLVLTRTLARAGAKAGVTANCISPGFIDSGSAPAEELEQMVKTIPAARIGTVDEVVGTARFLVSEEAGYINGANIVVSGAWGI